MPANLPLDELSTVFARIQGLLLTEETAHRAVGLLAEAARESVPGATGAGASLLDPQGRRTSTGYTNDLVLAADEIQYETGDGPCLIAWASTRVVRSNDLAVEKRWPAWSSRAAGLGIRSVVSAPLMYKAESIGAIKVYSTETNAFDQHSEHLLALLAGPAATLLANIQTEDVPHKISRGLRAAIESRDSIVLARGMLMERSGIGRDEAMRELLRLSRKDEGSLRSTAERIISSATARQQD